MSTIEFFFWSSLFMVFYAYGGYPIILLVISFFKGDSGGLREPNPSNDHRPKVSLLISAYNEESVIEAKILNSLSLDYSRDLLEIIVISDGSTDKTCEIVERYADKGIVLRHYEGRIGKTECLNRSVPVAQGNIIVFSDANSQYDRSAIKEMVGHFNDEKMGFVTGWTKYLSGGKEGNADSLGMYARIELWTKALESLIDSCVGADGAIFAIRKELYNPLYPHDINDFVIPLQINRQGYRGVLEENAFCFEKSAGGGKGEFFRQVRITNRTIRAIFNNAGLLSPLKYGIFSFELFSHKICRFLVPFFLLILIITNIILIGKGTICLISFAVQVSFYLLALSHNRGRKIKYLSGPVSLIHTFVLVNAAVFWAWITYLRGETFTTWVPTRI
jgi:glycosyltransferase involved in cell wall biosynthesis